MNPKWLKARQTKYAAYLSVYVLVIVAVVSVANVLANRYDKSYDSTANKRYSLSDQTIKIVKGLQQDATITDFDHSARFDQAKDLMERYKTVSSKIRLQYIDPDQNPQPARDAGITDYGTVTVQIGTKQEKANAVTEEGITGALIRDLKNSVRTVCFVSGHGEHQIDSSDRGGYSSLKDLLDKDNYTTKSISLLASAEVPGDCTVIVIGGPSTDYAQPEIAAIQKDVENGGRAMFLLDPPLKVAQVAISDNDALDAVLAGWGVTPGKDTVQDSNPIGQLLGVGPRVALVTTYASHAIVDTMKGTATGFPLSRPLTVQNTAKTAVSKLFDSSDTSVATPDLNTKPEDPRNKNGPLTLGTAGTYNTGKQDAQGRFVVIGSSNWVANSFINFNGNRDLALNAVNWLSSDEDLISIRPKDPDDRRVTMTAAQMNWVRIWSQFLLPLGVILIGGSVWWRRR